MSEDKPFYLREHFPCPGCGGLLVLETGSVVMGHEPSEGCRWFHHQQADAASLPPPDPEEK